MNRQKMVGAIALAAAGALTLAAVPASGTVTEKGTSGLTATQKLAWAHGLQVAPKSSKQIGPNPYLAEVADPRLVDYSYWNAKMSAAGKARAKSAQLAANQKAAGLTAKPVLVHDEEEAPGGSGSNDTDAAAEPITGFGTGTGKNPRVRILGSMADLSGGVDDLDPSTEDDGSIDLAYDTGIDGDGAVATTGTLGDGPHGSTGDASGDFDFYAATVDAGLTLTVDTSGTGLDTIVVIYDAEGTIVEQDDDGGEGLASLASYAVTEAGTYYVAVVGYSLDPLPADPFDSGSGSGIGREGAYDLSVAAQVTDRDVYALSLNKGDVLGATVTGDVTGLAVRTPNSGERIISELSDASSLYPPNSPLPGGGNTTLAYVAEQTGTYYFEPLPTVGTYDITANVFRPGTETDGSPKVQTVYLDFDGATVNTAVWGGPGVRTLSGIGSFLAKWGIPRADQAKLIRAVNAEVRENIAFDAKRGLNKNVQVEIVNSSSSPDIHGRTNVARVIVGGTIAESGINTIGIAQYIDPGNYGHEDEAVVLLDVLSDPDEGEGDQESGDGASLNTYLEDESDRIAFVAQALGNVISHEIGHTIGNYHTDSSNDAPGLMDEGGGFFGDNLYAVGDDRIGGTADDPDRDFILDNYSLREGFGGLENTANVSSWAYVKPLR